MGGYRRRWTAAGLGRRPARAAVAAGGGGTELVGTPVIALLGQSNAVGRADEVEYSPRGGVDYTAAESSVRYWIGRADFETSASWGDLEPGATTIGPEVCLGDLAREHDLANAHVFKYAKGGSSLRDAAGDNWDPNDTGSLWDGFVSSLNSALAAAPADAALHHVVWVQGESDAANATSADEYEDNLTAFIAAIRSEWGAQVRVHIVKLHSRAWLDASGSGGSNQDGVRKVRAAQVAVVDADPLAFLVDIEHVEIDTADDLHFSADGYLDIGQAFTLSVAEARGLISDQGDTEASALLDWDSGTFARASAKTLWDGATLSRFTAGEIVKDASGYVDIEGERTNQVTESDDITDAAWTAGATTDSRVTGDRLDGTSGDVSRITAADNQAGPSIATASIVGERWWSIFRRAAAGYLDYQARSRLDVSATAEEWGDRQALPTAWGRSPVGGSSATSSAFSLQPHYGAAGAPDSTDPILSSVVYDVAGIQVEVGDCASSLIETSGATSTRNADDLSFASGDVPAWMRSAAWGFGFTPGWRWDQLAGDRTFYCWGTDANNRIWYDASAHKVKVTQGGSVVAESNELVFRAGQALTVELDSAAGVVSVRGATTGNGDGPTGTAWTMPAADLQVGALSDLSEAVFGRLGEPYGIGDPPAFSYADVPDQLIRISSVEGSLVGSGGTLTAVNDVSGAGEPVTVSGSPAYTAADGGLNGQPSYTVSSGNTVEAAGLNKGNIAFVAAVFRLSTGLEVLTDGSSTVNRFLIYRDAGGAVRTPGGDTASGFDTSAGRKRALLAFDGATDSLWNGASMGTLSAHAITSTGVALGGNNSGAAAVPAVAFFMACSSVPSASVLAALEAKLIEDFG